MANFRPLYKAGGRIRRLRPADGVNAGSQVEVQATTGIAITSVVRDSTGTLTAAVRTVPATDQCLYYGDVAGQAHVTSVSTQNFVFGVGAFGNASGASQCVVIGANAGRDVTGGGAHMLIGSEAGAGITTGTDDICIGRRTGANLGTGSFCVFIGSEAGINATGILRCVGIGNDAMRSAAGVNSRDSIAIGFESMFSCTRTDRAIGIGAQTWRNATSPDLCVGIGHFVGRSAVAPFNCIFIGNTAGELITSPVNSIGIGGGAMRNLVSGGDGNIGTGGAAGDAITTGSENSFYGFLSGWSGTGQVATVDNGVCVGARTFTTGTNGMALGHGVGAAANQCVLGNTSITETQLRGNILIEDTHNIVFSTSGTGSIIGSTATNLMSFWGATPIVQPAGANQAALTNNTGGTYDGTLAQVSGSGADTAINDNFTDLYTLQDEIRTALTNAGIMKGAA